MKDVGSVSVHVYAFDFFGEDVSRYMVAAINHQTLFANLLCFMREDGARQALRLRLSNHIATCDFLLMQSETLCALSRLHERHRFRGVVASRKSSAAIGPFAFFGVLPKSSTAFMAESFFDSLE